MIFVTVGSQKFQFNRLLEKIDDMVSDGIIKEEVFAQSGYSDYKAKNYQYKQFLDREEFAEMEFKADIVITHGGTGAIIGAVKRGKKVLAVPRLEKYGEHVDNHQIELLKQFDGMKIIEVCYELNDFAQSFHKLCTTEYKPYNSNTINIIASIDEFMCKEIK